MTRQRFHLLRGDLSDDVDSSLRVGILVVSDNRATNVAQTAKQPRSRIVVPGSVNVLYAVVYIACFVVSALVVSPAFGENWPGWRGPRGDCSSKESNLPLHWNGETGENVTWKVGVAGEGHSSPIVWKNRIFLSSCLTDKQERVLICLDRNDGEQLWQRVVLCALP